jgi:hypothetical protein
VYRIWEDASLRTFHINYNTDVQLDLGGIFLVKNRKIFYA